MEERSYRNLPETAADATWNDVGVGYSSVYRVYVRKTKIYVYYDITETDQRKTWNNRSLYIMDKVAEIRELDKILPDRFIDVLNKRFPGLIPNDDPKTID